MEESCYIYSLVCSSLPYFDVYVFEVVPNVNLFFSNEYQIIQPTFIDEYHYLNPGSIKAAKTDARASEETLKAGKPVKSVKVTDLVTVFPSKSSTYIIKTDIEGFDCKVTFYTRNDFVTKTDF